MIDRNTIDRIFSTADIVEVIGEFVNLKKTGQNYRGLSPFTNEKTPSFFVSPAKGIFKCFSSGIGGNVITFLMEHEKISYPDALRYLAKKYNIEISEKEETAEELKIKNERESLLAVNQFACQYFMDNLKTTEGRNIGKGYLTERGIREDAIRKFQIGYSLDDRYAFAVTAAGKGFKTEYLVKSGLVIEHENNIFDRFHGRIIFPLHSLSGQILGFAGRIIKSNDKSAKYINSPESEIYHKSDLLYGLFLARHSILKHDKCYLVEGYTDVISMHQGGIENVVASSGTSLTMGQIRLLKRFTRHITVLYDGDEPGIRASLRGIDLLLEEGLNVRVVLLPDGEDPDSFARKNSSVEFNAFIAAHETDFITFKVGLLQKEANKDPIKKAFLISEIVGSIAVIPESITRSVYIRECSKIFDFDEGLLYNETAKFRRKRFSQAIKDNRSIADHIPLPVVQYSPRTLFDDKYNSEKEVIRLLLLYGNQNFTFRDEKNTTKEISVNEFLIGEIEKDELEFNHPVFSQIFAEIKKALGAGILDMERYFITHPDENIGKMVVDLITSAHDLSKIWKRFENYFASEEMRLPEIVPEALLSFKNEKVIRLIKETEDDLLHAQEHSDGQLIYSLQAKIIALNNLKMQLSKDLGERIVIIPAK